jgi:hypothetical protein
MSLLSLDLLSYVATLTSTNKYFFIIKFHHRRASDLEAAKDGSIGNTGVSYVWAESL